MPKTHKFWSSRIKKYLTDDLRKPPWKGHPNPIAGHCYVASEALYHLLKGQRGKWRPEQLKHEGVSHWYLRHKKTGTVLDLTVSQFKKIPPYHKGKSRGFLTKRPSKRAAQVISNVLAEDLSLLYDLG